MRSTSLLPAKWLPVRSEIPVGPQRSQLLLIEMVRDVTLLRQAHAGSIVVAIFCRKATGSFGDGSVLWFSLVWLCCLGPHGADEQKEDGAGDGGEEPFLWAHLPGGALVALDGAADETIDHRAEPDDEQQH